MLGAGMLGAGEEDEGGEEPQLSLASSLVLLVIITLTVSFASGELP